jgi:hypothetical protein
MDYGIDYYLDEVLLEEFYNLIKSKSLLKAILLHYVPFLKHKDYILLNVLQTDDGRHLDYFSENDLDTVSETILDITVKEIVRNYSDFPDRDFSYNAEKMSERIVNNIESMLSEDYKVVDITINKQSVYTLVMSIVSDLESDLLINFNISESLYTLKDVDDIMFQKGVFNIIYSGDSKIIRIARIYNDEKNFNIGYNSINV